MTATCDLFARQRWNCNGRKLVGESLMQPVKLLVPTRHLNIAELQRHNQLLQQLTVLNGACNLHQLIDSYKLNYIFKIEKHFRSLWERNEKATARTGQQK